ncbi:MAG: hypothetical protein LBK57_09665 [Clostridiales Family XIII bacterium]|jgi:hypothetical protein|nr:hypothetical protein [Clostridiales Family XIII bacterium]
MAIHVQKQNNGLINVSFSGRREDSQIIDLNRVNNVTGEIAFELFNELHGYGRSLFIMSKIDHNDHADTLCMVNFTPFSPDVPQYSPDDLNTLISLLEKNIEASSRYKQLLHGKTETPFFIWRDAHCTTVTAKCDDGVIVAAYHDEHPNSNMGAYIAMTSVYFAKLDYMYDDKRLGEAISGMLVDRDSPFINIYGVATDIIRDYLLDE